ncbi:MAG: GspE/PulE family protein [Patescibacteria group bacterium]
MASPKDFEEKLAKQREEAEENDAKRRAQKLGLPYLDLISVKTPTEIKAMALVPASDAEKAFFVPLQILRKKVVVAAFDPALPETKIIIERLKKDYEVQVYVVSKRSLRHAWDHYKYIIPEAKEITGGVEVAEANLEKIGKSVKTLTDLQKEIEGFGGPATSQILEIILGGASALKASDIHLEPTEDKYTLRLRLDGLLQTVSAEIEKAVAKPVLTRIKLLSGLKLNITDEPQDGRFSIHFQKRDVEVRTSVIPSEYGETVVMRILDPISLKTDLEELGFRPDDLLIAEKEIQKPNGLILNTGPTGSGKTTTLYAFLRAAYKPEIKIITIEDPIEYHLPGISQTQVDPDAKYTFASGLRSILRQDPDVVLVGEIRDKETAEIALNASLTGHLVFSTLHTNDAVGAIPRLIDLEAKPQVIGPGLSLIIAQRLIRTLCASCKKEKKADAKLKAQTQKFLESLPKRVSRKPYENFSIYESRGCTKCNNLGFRGRTSIFEMFAVDQAVEEAIYKNATEIDLKRLAKNQGMVTMQEDGVLKTLLGLTSFEEVERLTGVIAFLH